MEVYGKDGSPQQDLPYSVSEQRLSVRLITPDADMPVVRPSVSESREYHYERMAADPQCSQSVILQCRMSTVTRCVKRRFIIRAVRNRQNPLPDTLPASLFDSGYDDQQLQLIVSLSQHARHHLTNLNRNSG